MARMDLMGWTFCFIYVSMDSKSGSRCAIWLWSVQNNLSRLNLCLSIRHSNKTSFKVNPSRLRFCHCELHQRKLHCTVMQQGWMVTELFILLPCTSKDPDLNLPLGTVCVEFVTSPHDHGGLIKPSSFLEEVLPDYLANENLCKSSPLYPLSSQSWCKVLTQNVGFPQQMLVCPLSSSSRLFVTLDSTNGSFLCLHYNLILQVDYYYSFWEAELDYCSHDGGLPVLLSNIYMVLEKGSEF